MTITDSVCPASPPSMPADPLSAPMGRSAEQLLNWMCALIESHIYPRAPQTLEIPVATLRAWRARAREALDVASALTAPVGARRPVNSSFAEIPDVVPTLLKLPRMCLAYLPGTREVTAIRRGVSGYYPIRTRLTPEDYNERHGITADEVEAMQNGSAFGWEIPAADPDIVRALRERDARRVSG